MIHKSLKLTTSQFAKMHNINKRTLHYYDEIGLFSPLYKGENLYRYYDISQSIEFEYIRMLKELHMSLDEIENYLCHPTTNHFMNIADEKINDIDTEIKKLKNTKAALQKRKQMLEICNQINDGDIYIGEHKQDYLYITNSSLDENDTDFIFSLHQLQDQDFYLHGFGSYISLDKVINHDFSLYNGLFVPTKHQKLNAIIRPGGQYLYAYSIGDWNKLPALYENILKYADKNHLTLTGYAYEIGMNEIAISHMDEYITQIMIQIK